MVPWSGGWGAVGALYLLVLQHLIPVPSGRRILSSQGERQYRTALFNATSAAAVPPQQQQHQEERRHRRSLTAAVSVGAGTLPTVDGHKVKSLPGLKSNVKINHYAGHLTVDEEKGGNIFYWLVEAEGVDPATAPLLIWLNGGPGCSSMDGLFLELGPFRLDGDKLDQIKINPGSWHYAANVLFVDQPVGTGLSYTRSNDGYAGTDAAVNEHFYTFLTAFFKLHDRYTAVVNGKRRSRAFYISGESHAGHYIPCIAAHILKKNIEAATSTDPAALHIDLKGIALGNPWTDPYNQYDVSDFAHGHGLVTVGQRNRLKEKNRECRSLLREGKYNQKVCFDLLDDVIDSSSLSGSHKVLMYDSRRFVHSTGVFPPGHEAVEKYLNRADVKAAIHATATPQPYVECADPPFLALSHQDGKGVVQELVEVLQSGVRMLLYSGQYDIICNHMGTERMLQELPWNGREEWLKAQPGVWLVDKQPAGYIKTFKNLQSLLVLNAGHMVPMDVPKIALDMITRFLGDKDFSAGNALVGVSLLNPEEIRCENTGLARPAKRGGGTLTGVIKKAFGYGYNSSDNARHRQLQRGGHRMLRQPAAPAVAVADPAASSSHFVVQPLPTDFCLESPGAVDASSDSVCSASLVFTLGPLSTAAQPWSDASLFEGYEKVLRDLLTQDVRTALSTASPPAPADLEVAVAGLEPVMASEDEAVPSGARIAALRGFVSVRGRREDTTRAVGALRAQSGARDSVLRRGLLTSVLQQAVEVVVVRRVPHRTAHAAPVAATSTGAASSALQIGDPPPLLGAVTAVILDYASEIFYILYMFGRYNTAFLAVVVGLLVLGVVLLRRGAFSPSVAAAPAALAKAGDHDRRC